MQTTSTITNTDLLIVGQGLVGQALANQLKDLPITITLIDQKSHDFTNTDPRILALNPNSIDLLYGHHQPKQAYAIKQVHLHTVPGYPADSLTSKANTQLGSCIPLVAIEQHLLAQLKSHNINWINKATFVDITSNENAHLVRFTKNKKIQEVKAKLVIGADGCHSPVASSIPTNDAHSTLPIMHSYLWPVTLQKPYSHQAWFGIMKYAFLAYIPSQDKQGKLIVTTRTPLASPSSWLETQKKHLVNFPEFDLQNHFHYTSETFYRQSKQNGVLLLGQAASCLPPIGAQQLNSALIQVQYVTHQIKSMLEQNQPLNQLDPHQNHLSTLATYHSLIKVIQYGLTYQQLPHRLKKLGHWAIPAPIRQQVTDYLRGWGQGAYRA